MKWRRLRDWSISALRNNWESWDCLSWRKHSLSGTSSNVGKYAKGGEKRTEPGSVQRCPVTGQGAMGTVPVAQLTKHKQCCLNTENSLTVEGDWALKKVVQRYCEISTTGDIKKLSRPEKNCGPWWPAVGVWAGSLEQMMPRCPFKPQPFCPPVTSVMYGYHISLDCCDNWGGYDKIL